ncbi:MAG: bifunctional phosphoglucose/phosphomannose isomerase [Candidatus Rokubacteria bacterium]|nr:bifunctional phosphoglucose/phosphomannose isomerase [Candidatus Rokubacteria bacterium]
MTLDDLGDIKRIDVHDTRDVLAAFAAQCREATGLVARPAPSIDRPSAVVVAGMGGSAASGDLLAACAADRADVPILVHRGYGLPPVAGRRALVIASSYSGETAEVISALEAAIARGVPALVITAGGRLAELAAQYGLPRVALPGGLMPRMALGNLFFPALSVLAGVGISVATDAEVAEALETVDALGAELVPERPTRSNEAKRLALAIGNRIPAIYGGQDTGPIAYRWKTDVEENAKTFAIAGSLPEMNHNEIEAWRAPAAGGFHLLLLRDHAELPEITRRFTVLRELVEAAAGGVSESWTRGRGRLARLLSLAYLGQWTSYYLAILREIDPWTIPLLDELKRRMRTDFMGGPEMAPQTPQRSEPSRGVRGRTRETRDGPR